MYLSALAPCSPSSPVARRVQFDDSMTDSSPSSSRPASPPLAVNLFISTEQELEQLHHINNDDSILMSPPRITANQYPRKCSKIVGNLQ